MTESSTIKFTVPSDDKENMRTVLRSVFDALNEKGYNPINQIVGYLLTEDPTYITNYNSARSMICKLDRDELLQDLVNCYLFHKFLSIREAYATAKASPSFCKEVTMAENKGLTYKGHPLMRKDNLIYYGSMADSHIVMLQILETKKQGDFDIATRVSVQLQLTDPAAKSRDRIVKKSEKSGLYTALDVGCVWLERALAGK